MGISTAEKDQEELIEKQRELIKAANEVLRVHHYRCAPEPEFIRLAAATDALRLELSSQEIKTTRQKRIGVRADLERTVFNEYAAISINP